MRLLVDQGLLVMDITKAALLRLRIIKLRLQYNGKMQAIDQTLRADFGLTNERHFINMESIHKYGKCRSEGNKR